MNAEHVRDLAVPVNAARAGHTSTSALAQTGNELAAQFTPGLRVEGGLDRFVEQVAFAVMGEDALAGTADLLGRPPPFLTTYPKNPQFAGFLLCGRGRNI